MKLVAGPKPANGRNIRPDDGGYKQDFCASAQEAARLDVA